MHSSVKLATKVASAIDVEDQERAQALHAGEKRILEMAAKGDSLSEILDSLCRLVEQQTEEAIASILLLENNRLRHGSAPSLPKTYTDAIDGTEIGPGVGSCGTAAYTGKQVIVEDISTDPLWTDYRDVALPHGLRACWSTPVLSSEGKVIATFAMYYREPRRPSLRDREIIEQITHLAEIAIERKLTQEAIRVSEARYRVLVEHAPEAIVVLDFEQGRFVEVNENAVRLFGRSKEELLKVGPVELSPAVQPDGRPSKELALEMLRRAVEGGTPVFEWTHLNAAGQKIPSEIRLVRIPTSGGILIRGSVTDITRRKRTQALLAGEKRLLEMIATGVSLKKIANALCEVIEEQRPDTLASVLLLNPDGVHLDVIAGSKLPPDWTRQMEKLPVGPCAGSCGTAAYLGERVIVADIATDPLWNLPEHRSAALRHGLRASWSSPVRSSKGKVLGTFCMYYRQALKPTEQDFELIELATHLARVAIERDRAEKALRASEQLARSHVDVIMRSLDVLATEAAPKKFIGEMLRTIGQSLHASRVLLWLRNKTDDALHLHLLIEDGQQLSPHEDHPFVRDAHRWKKDGAFVQEMLFTKAPLVFDDINNDSRIDPDLREYFIRRGAKKFLTVPMFVAGEFSGFIGIHHAEEGAYRTDEIELAQALAHHVMLAVHGQELVDQQRQAAILKERTRMARDIHDNLAQGFTGVIVQMEAADEALLDDDPENAARHIRRAGDLARESLGEARRSVHALRPQALEKAGFADALKAIIQNTTAGTSLRAEFQLKGEPRELSSDVEENLLHIGQEALTNAMKHARASRFQAQLSFDSESVRLELSDNGDGFVVEKANGGGIGLIGMKERAEQIGATLIFSSEPGVGTSIVAVSRYQNSPT